MCIVVDINTLGSVFKKNSEYHDEFKPVFDWVYDGKGKIVYGGSKYIEELGEHYRDVFLELRKARKAEVVDLKKVDEREIIVTTKIKDEDFDDQHIVALLIESGCKLICSHDKRAYPFFTHSDFFHPAEKKPKIYRGSSNKDLLNDRNIADICLPCKPTTNAQRELMTLIKP